MELKCTIAKQGYIRLRSNRTFMELKFNSIVVMSSSHTVLIVPLWNWNYRQSGCLSWTLLVLIVPLWNWNEPDGVAALPLVRSNRTFMELKWLYKAFLFLVSSVLIVPLWNWNNRNAFDKTHRHMVLIVPLWNWNVIMYSVKSVVRCSNRTFMELK